MVRGFSLSIKAEGLACRPVGVYLTQKTVDSRGGVMSSSRRFLCVAATATVAGLLGPGATGVAGAASDNACRLFGAPPGETISFVSQELGNSGQNNPGFQPATNSPPLVTQACPPPIGPPPPGSGG
jgi:hypothetical protein